MSRPELGAIAAGCAAAAACCRETDAPWPRISVVTPSFNQARFVETTIRSVVDQGYPALEYIVMDGGSTDGSRAVIERYSDRLAHWESRPDGGQSDAIQRGFERAGGEILAYLNSDDYLLPGALRRAGTFFRSHPEAQLLIGTCDIAREDGRRLERIYGYAQDYESILHLGMRFGQPACFWRRSAFFAVGGLDTAMRFAFDADLFLKLARLRRPGATLASLAVYRRHPATKSDTLGAVLLAESALLRERYGYAGGGERRHRAIVRRATASYALARLRGRLHDLVIDPGWFAAEWAHRARGSEQRR